MYYAFLILSIITSGTLLLDRYTINYLFMVMNFKLYYIHINNKYIPTIYSYNYITFDTSYVNHPDICFPDYP